MITCENCSDAISIEHAKYYSAYAYCESCFDDLFTYCDQCDTTIERESAIYDSDGNGICAACHQENYDDDSPANPYVDQADRELIVKLCRNWIFTGRKSFPISINEADQYLKELREAVGLVPKPIYLYGLIDREDFQIKATHDLIPKVNSFISKHLRDITAIEEIEGKQRLGISSQLRLNHFGLITKLIKEELCVE